MQPKRGRVGLREYQRFFKFGKHEIAGKKVLDVGAGKALFEKEARHVGANVVSLDPSYLHANIRQKRKNPQNQLVAGKAEHLPFKTHAFDIALARHVIPARIHGRKQYHALLEMLRTTRPTGWIAIGPFTTRNDLQSLAVTTQLLQHSHYSFKQYPITVTNPRTRAKIKQTYLKIQQNGDWKQLAQRIQQQFP